MLLLWALSMSFKPSSIFVPLMTTCSDIGRACREESACLHWLTAAWLWLKHMDQCMLSNTPCRHTLMHTYIHYTIQPKPNNKSQAQDWSPPTVLLQEEWGGVRWQRVGWHPPIPQKATDKLPLVYARHLCHKCPADLLRSHQYKTDRWYSGSAISSVTSQCLFLFRPKNQHVRY